MRGLEIGGGAFPAHPEFEQFDLADWSERTGLTYRLGDARKLPYDDGTFDRVYASNLLEHFGWRETNAVLKEWVRVLVPDGQLEVVTPDLLGIIVDYETGVNSWVECVERIAGSQDYPGNTHLAFFTYDEFDRVLRDAGLRLIKLERSHRGGGITATAHKPS